MNGTLFTPDQRQVPVTVTLGDKVMFVSTDKFKTAVDLAGESVHILRSDCISTLVDTIAGIRIEVDTREIPICTIDETFTRPKVCPYTMKNRLYHVLPKNNTVQVSEFVT